LREFESIFEEFDKEPYSEEFYLVINQIRNELSKQEDEINKKLDFLGEICKKNGEHDWEYSGSTSHDNIYECKICGRLDRG
jgi:hypothetical protein